MRLPALVVLGFALLVPELNGREPVRIVFDKIPEGIVLRPGMNVDATIFTK